MDLTAQVNGLEEEVNLLKGEIKTILQEVRTAVLSQENPFALNGGDVSTGTIVRVEVPAAERAAPDAESGDASNVVKLREASSSNEAPMQPPAGYGAWAREMPSKPDPARDDHSQNDAPGRWSIHSLAALMAWTRESAQRFNATDLGLILALARYGRLIDKDLEGTLTNLAEVMAPEEAPPTATSTDFLLALRQLDALLDEATATAEAPARRAS